MDGEQSNKMGWIWVVGIISVIALVLAWMAYDRSGENLTTQIQQEATELVEETEQSISETGNNIKRTAETTQDEAQIRLARAEARAELIALQTEIEAEQNYTETVDRVERVQTNLRSAYQNAETSTQAEWREIDNNLEKLKQSLRSNSADALETARGLILILEDDVRMEE
jgi:hypothetical protein